MNNVIHFPKPAFKMSREVMAELGDEVKTLQEKLAETLPGGEHYPQPSAPYVMTHDNYLSLVRLVLLSSIHNKALLEDLLSMAGGAQ